MLRAEFFEELHTVWQRRLVPCTYEHSADILDENGAPKAKTNSQN
jgi:hypothetical protein